MKIEELIEKDVRDGFYKKYDLPDMVGFEINSIEPCGIDYCDNGKKIYCVFS